MDQRLAAMIAALEQGRTMTPIGMIVGPWIIQGTPISDAEYMHWTADRIDKLGRQNLTGRDRRQIDQQGDDAPQLRAIQDRVNYVADMLGGTSAPVGTALCLISVAAYSDVGTVNIPTVRVPFEAISTWWVTDFQHTPMKISGGGVSVAF